MEVVIISPAFDVILPDQIEGADQLHSLKVGAVELGHHGLELAGIQHAHQDCFNDIVIMMAQGDLIAAQLFGLAVKVAPAHPGAQVAGRFFDVIDSVKDLRIKKGDRDIQELRVILDDPAILLVVAGIHAQEDQLKGEFVMPFEFLEQLGHQHGVLAAGNADRDLIAFLHQLIADDCLGKTAEQILAELFGQALFHLLPLLFIGRFPFDLFQGPASISLGDMTGLISPVPQEQGQVFADDSVFTI